MFYRGFIEEISLKHVRAVSSFDSQYVWKQLFAKEYWGKLQFDHFKLFKVSLLNKIYMFQQIDLQMLYTPSLDQSIAFRFVWAIAVHCSQCSECIWCLYVSEIRTTCRSEQSLEREQLTHLNHHNKYFKWTKLCLGPI